MATVLFVHGTGVRKGSFLSTFAILQRAFEQYGIEHDLEPCLWGDALGATAPQKSLPKPIEKAGTAAALTRDQEYARWDLLYRDPAFELRLLKNRPVTGPRSPAAAAAAEDLWERITAYTPSTELTARLQAADLEPCFRAAFATIIIEDGPARQAITTATEIGETGQAIARSVVAEMLREAFEQERPMLDGRSRDAIVNRLIDDWEARVAGIGAFLLGFFGDVAATVATPIVKARRGDLTDASASATGDILRYQSRGGPIRDYIASQVASIKGDVYLLAHSLGGIACVDLLASTPLDQVKGLITAGSQAPYMFEISALWGLEPGAPALPAYFPKWLNLYDPYDFLSYVAAPVFPTGVTDCRIVSDQPFPQSHSAYWTNPDTWTAIRQFLS